MTVQGLLGKYTAPLHPSASRDRIFNLRPGLAPPDQLGIKRTTTRKIYIPWAGPWLLLEEEKGIHKASVLQEGSNDLPAPPMGLLPED